MRINKEDFLVQVKYSDLLLDAESIDKYFLGFGGELYLSAEEIHNCDFQTIDNIKFFVKDKRLSLRLHAPITEIDYSRPKETLDIMLPLYKSVLELCGMLQTSYVVAHAEFNYHIDFPVEDQLEAAIFLWGALFEEFRSNRIHFIIENHTEVKPGDLITLMEKINSPYFGLCIDIGHSNAFSNLDIKKWLERYPLGSIKEVHIADNEGDGDTHLPLGEGNIDFASFFEMFADRREKCAFVLEPKNIGEAERSLLFLTKLGVFI